MYSFIDLEHSVVPCPVLTVASWPAYRFHRRQIWWSGILISLRIFQLVVILTVKDFGEVNKAGVDDFVQLSSFFLDRTDGVNLISGSSAFSKSSLNIWKFMVHIVLKTDLEDFEHYFASVWDECNCVVVWTFRKHCPGAEKNSWPPVMVYREIMLLQGLQGSESWISGTENLNSLVASALSL